MRLAGGLVAAFLERAFGVFSEKLGRAVGDKIRTFRAGLDTMRSFSDFAAVGLALAGHVAADCRFVPGDDASICRQPATGGR